MDGSGKPQRKGLFRSRKRVFSFCLVVLAVSFAAIMLGGHNQSGMYKIHRWFDSGSGYQPGRDAAGDPAPAKIYDMLRHSDYAKIRSNRLDNGDDISKGSLGLSVKDANSVESELAILFEDAENTSAPIGGAFHAIAKQALATEGAVQNVKSVLKNDITDVERAPSLDTRQALPKNDAFYTVTKQANQSKRTESKEPPPIEGTVQDLSIIPVDKGNASIHFPRKNGDAAQTTESFISSRTTTKAVYYDMCEKCCYRYTTIDHDITIAFNDSRLKERGCKKRLPDAMIFGVKKGGTTTLKNFLSYHPDIAFTQKELKFFTSYSKRQEGMEYYRNSMIYSAPGQISMEKTPAYYHYPKVPAIIKKALPNVKLIIIMRDPVERAISDFVHMQVTIAKRCFKVKPYTGSSVPTNITSRGIEECDFSTRYVIEDTFDKSVINSNGKVNSTSQLIAKGVYVKDIQRYLKYFEPEQILAIDGEAFIHDPYQAVKNVEQFLGIRDYFTRDHFYYDPQKGFFCLNKPIPNNCMNQAKGRPHPVVKEETLQKLRDFYRPFNQALKQLVKLDLHWSS